MKRFTHLVVFVAVAALMSSCVSMSTMQTARTTDPGKFVYGSGVGFTTMQIEGELYGLPMAEVYTRIGILDNLDVGARWTIPGTFLFDAKYMVYGDQESSFAVSTGGGLGYLASYTMNDVERKRLDFMLPVYATYYPTSWLALYGAPKYFLKTGSDTNIETQIKTKTSEHWYGTSLGIRLGKEDWKNCIFMEYSFYGNSVGMPASQIVVGYGYGLK